MLTPTSIIVSNFSFLQESFGILFDIDGVIARGYVPLPVAVEAFKVINDAHINIPTAFVTNAVTLNDYKAGQLTEWLGVKVWAHFDGTT